MVLAVNISAQSANKTDKLFQDYLSIKDALVSDNSAKAATAAGDFMKTLEAANQNIPAEQFKALKADAGKIQQSKEIKTQRDAFFGLSDNMVELMKKTKSSTAAFVQYCPMAKGKWLSSKKDIKNPYYGKSMLECGYVTEEIKYNKRIM